MRLSPSDQDKLLLAVAGHDRPRPPRPRREAQPSRGGRAAVVLGDRGARATGRSVAELMEDGPRRARARRRHGGRARAGRRGPGRGDVPRRPQARHAARADRDDPRRAAQPRRASSSSTPGRETSTLRVLNTGDRPIQVGSHFHFADVNDALDVRPRGGDRASGSTSRRARRCASSRAPSATSTLVALAGARRVPGLQDPRMSRIVARALRARCTARRSATGCGSPTPTSGSRSRRTAASAATRRSSAAARRSASRCCRARTTSRQGAPDLVITNVVVLDHWGIVSCDVGIRDGRIVALGKAGNPDIADGVHPALRDRPDDRRSSPARAASSPPAASTATCTSSARRSSTRRVAAGMTTLIGGGTGPSRGHARDDLHAEPAGARARCCSRWTRMPVNVLLLGKGNTVSDEGLREQLRAGAGGFKLHEDWGSTPAAIDACLRVADETGVQVAIHTDTLNEAGYLQSTLAAIAGRTIHAYHTEGAGGGHAPDIIELAVAAERAAVLDEPDAPAHGQHGRRAPRHADRLPPPQPAHPGGPRVRREPHPRRRRSPPRTSCTTSARSR